MIKRLIVPITILLGIASLVGYYYWADNTTNTYEGMLIGQKTSSLAASLYILGDDSGNVLVIKLNPTRNVGLWVGNKYRITITKSGIVKEAEPIETPIYRGKINYEQLFRLLGDNKEAKP